jgi:hypothetical protein
MVPAYLRRQREKQDGHTSHHVIPSCFSQSHTQSQTPSYLRRQREEQDGHKQWVGLQPAEHVALVADVARVDLVEHLGDKYRGGIGEIRGIEEVVRRGRQRR